MPTKMIGSRETGSSGLLVREVGCVLVPILRCMVSFEVVPDFLSLFDPFTYTTHAEMKLIVAAIYSNYTSHVVDDDGMENQSDGYTGRPENERLFLRFEKVVQV